MARKQEISAEEALQRLKDGNEQVLAQRIIPELESKEEPVLGHDSSTNNLIRRYRRHREA
jgi:hypothetical protein